MVNADAPDADSSWQRRAVDRSLSNARERAVSRSGQILDAARSLMEESGGLDFTVQDIVDRSALSLRSFYKHFGGKDELLLALVEEVLGEFADALRSEVEAFDDPVERLRAYVVGFHRRAEGSSGSGARALGIYHVRMLEVRRDDFVAALGPQMELLAEIVEEGVAAGRFRHDLGAHELTGLLTITLMSAAQMRVLDVSLNGAAIASDDLWAWCAAAIGLELEEPGRRTTRRTPQRTPAPRRARASAAVPRSG